MNLGWQYGHGCDADSAAAWTGFYQSAEFADEQTVVHHLQRVLPELRTESCHIANVWCVPGKRLDVVYRFGSPPDAESIVTVRFCRRGESAAALSKLGQLMVLPSAVVQVPAWDAVAWTFPSDPGLPDLGAMIDQRRLARLLHRPTEVAASWRLLSYLPGRRCTLRYRWEGNACALVGKVGEGSDARHRILDGLWRSSKRGFAMPEPVGSDASIDVRFERFVDGQRLETALESGEAEQTMSRVAAAVAALHAMPFDGLPVRDADRVLARLDRKVLPLIETALPQHAPRAHALSRALAARRDAMPTRRCHTIHGDLHTANLLLQPDRAVFIDLDDIASGDAAYDLALLGSRLLLASLPGRLSHPDIGALVAALPACYASHGGDEIPEAVYAWYLAALLIGRQVKTCIRHVAPGLPALAERLIALAEVTLARGKFDGSLK